MLSLKTFLQKFYKTFGNAYFMHFKSFKRINQKSIPLLFKNYTRYIYPILGGAIITLSLLYLMTILIAQKKYMSSTNQKNISIQLLSLKEIEELKTTDRLIPEKPKQASMSPITPKVPIQKNNIEPPKLSIPKQTLKLSKSLTKQGQFAILGYGAGNRDQGDSEVTPIVRIEPQYPRKAALIGAEGFVILQFDITSVGTVTNISILQASPPNIFNNNAIKALQKWKYKPKIVHNKPMMQKGLKVRLDFILKK